MLPETFMIIDPRASNAALLIVPDHRVGNRDSARVVRPDSPARLARTEREVLELEDVIDGHIGHRTAARTVEEDPVQHGVAGVLGPQSENPAAGPVIVTFWMFIGLPRSRIGDDPAVELRNWCVPVGSAGFRSVAEMVWPPPSTVVMAAGTVSDVVTSPQSAVNVNVASVRQCPPHTRCDVSSGNGSGVSHPASRGEEARYGKCGHRHRHHGETHPKSRHPYPPYGPPPRPGWHGLSGRYHSNVQNHRESLAACDWTVISAKAATDGSEIRSFPVGAAILNAAPPAFHGTV